MVVISLEAELSGRVSPPPAQLPRDFLPLALDREGVEWARYGLPPRPADPAALAIWRDMLAPPIHSVQSPGPPFSLHSDMAFSSFRRFGEDPREGGGDGTVSPALLRGRLGSSRNWSGAVIFPRGGQRFIQVLASWTVPLVTVGEGPGPFVCSTWIGLDGLRGWMTSMPQMGTAQALGSTGGPYSPTFAWWQWWLKGRDIQKPMHMRAVSAGNRVYCAVTLLPPDQPAPGDRDKVQFFLRVEGDAHPHSITVAGPPDNFGGPPVPAQGASAQWILERPTALQDSPNGNVREGKLYPLPNFGDCGAERFAAVLADAPDSAITNAATRQAPELEPQSNLRTPRTLRMIERREDPTRIAVIATPIEAKDGRVTVRYKP